LGYFRTGEEALQVGLARLTPSGSDGCGSSSIIQIAYHSAFRGAESIPAQDNIVNIQQKNMLYSGWGSAGAPPQPVSMAVGQKGAYQAQ
jgi:hypothetical protein